MNDAGDVIADLDSFSGWLRTSDGANHLIEFPGAVNGTSVVAINNRRQIVGYYRGDDFVERPFLWEGGTFSSIPIPAARGVAVDVNDAGAVVGWYDAGATMQTFIATAAGITTVPLAAGAWARQPMGINNGGAIVGVHGLLAPPFGAAFRYEDGHDQAIPEPAACAGEFVLPVAITTSGSVLATCGATAYVTSGTDAWVVSLPTLAFPLGMNASGTAFVGVEYDQNGRALPFIARFPRFVDPVPQLLDGPAVVSDDFDALASEGRPVVGVAADGVARVVVRIPAASAGQAFTVRLLNDHEPRALSTSTQEDGALLSLTAQSNPVVQLTVNAVTTTQGDAVAFVLYRAPEDFPRVGTPVALGAFGPDDNRAGRQVFLEITPQGGAPFTQVVEIVRPPVMLVHGIWSNANSWEFFSPLSTGADPRFTTGRADFYEQVDVASTLPAQPDGSLTRVRANSLGLNFNAKKLTEQAAALVRDFAKGANGLGISVAAAKADFVGHSMGGVVVRTLSVLPGYQSELRFGGGIIHKLVSMNTPHRGSPMATGLLQTSNTCLRSSIVDLEINEFLGLTLYTYEVNNFAIARATLRSGEVVDGAIGDLVDAPLSLALQLLAAANVRLPIAYVATSYERWSALNGFRPHFLRDHCPTDPLAQALTPSDWPMLFGGPAHPTDGVVGRTSQINGASSAVEDVPDHAHSGGMLRLGFDPPHAQYPGEVQVAVVKALNRPAYLETYFRPTP